jgi:cytochrome bd-type quinol oxidase subunit 2
MLETKLFRCYSLRFLLGVLLTTGVVVALAAVARGLEKGSVPRFVLGAVQAVLMGAVIGASVLLIRRLDELQQRIHHEALALAFAATAALVTGYAFLEKAGLPPVRWTLWAWPLMVVLWMIGLLIVQRRYQ